MRKKAIIFVFSFCCLIGCQTSFTQPESHDNETSLMKAIRSRDITNVKQLIESGADVNETSKYLTTPLSAAIETNQIDIVKLLLEHGASDRTGLDIAVKEGNMKMAEFLIQQKFYLGTSIVYAAEANNLEMVQMLVNNGADVNASQKRRDRLLLPKYFVTPIQMAIQNNNKEMCLYLLDKGVLLETAIDECFTRGKNELLKTLIDRSTDVNQCFQKAFKAGNMEIIQYCIQKGADKNSRDEAGKTIFLLAVESGNLENAKFCIDELKMNPNDVSSRKETVLMLAAKTGNTAMLSYLLTLGIAMEAQNNSGETALFYALEAENDASFNFLVERQANISHLSNDKSTLLLKAVQEEQLEVAEYLISKGIPVDAKNTKGQTAFQVAISAFFKNEKLIYMLLDKGANIETKDDEGRTLLFLEVESGNLDKVKLLHKRGANINTRDNNNNRPAVNSAEMVRYLVENGADVNALDSRHDTYMCNALEFKDLELAQYLIDKGIDVNENCYFDEPPLVKAIEDESVPFVEFLVNNNANVNAKGYFNKSVMEYAKEKGNAQIIELLKNPGTGTKQQGGTDKPAATEIEKKLEQTVYNKQTDEVEHLLKENETFKLKEDLVKQIASLGAAEGRLYLIDHAIKKLGLGINDPINLDKQTLLIIAARNQKINAVNYLLDHGADKNLKDYYNKKALDYAKDGEIQEILK